MFGECLPRFLVLSLANMPDWLVCVLRGALVRLCVIVLLIDPLSPHEHFGFAVQREGAVIFPEAVKQLQVFELAVLVAH